MRRPHRSIETFDISLMAVVTKAMGAFLVLMLLLLPYYTPNKLTQQDTQDLVDQIQEVRNLLNKTSEQIDSKDIKTAQKNLEFSAELVRKLRALLDKTLAEKASLEKEVEILNRQVEILSQDLVAAEDEIARLREELERLKKRDQLFTRGMFVNYRVNFCDDVKITGAIIRTSGESKYIWSDDKTPIRPEHLFYVNLKNFGGIVSSTIPEKIIRHRRSRGIKSERIYWRNAGLIVNTNLSVDDYIVVILKRHWSKTRKIHGAHQRLLVDSMKECIVDYQTNAMVLNKWNSLRAQRARLRKETVGGIIAAFKSEQDKITFVTPTSEQVEWFESLLDRTLAEQTEVQRQEQLERNEERRGDDKEKKEEEKKKDSKKDPKANLQLRKKDLERLQLRISDLKRLLKDQNLPDKQREALEKMHKNLEQAEKALRKKDPQSNAGKNEQPQEKAAEENKETEKNRRAP